MDDKKHGFLGQVFDTDGNGKHDYFDHVLDEQFADELDEDKSFDDDWDDDEFDPDNYGDEGTWDLDDDDDDDDDF